MIIGIDLGTSNSVVAVYKDKSIKIIPNEEGSFLTKSRVFINKEKLKLELVNRGLALALVKTDPNDIEILEVKRLMGLDLSSDFHINETKVSLNFLNYSFKNGLIEDKYTPEEISAEILKYLKKTAEDYLNEPITKAVITVPAYFNDAQRSATKKAAILAGLDPIRILNEPTSASLAYNLESKKDQTILVFDLGGGTFDVSILKIEDGIFNVLGTSGSTTLGGSNFDNEIIKYILEKKPNISQKNLKKIAEEAKIALTYQLQTTINLDNETLTLTKTKFEELCLPFFRECLILTENLLKDLFLNKSNIDEIVLVGGSTRIPKIFQMLSELFPNKTINNKINPDEIVARGAAIQGAILNNTYHLENILLDIIPLNLGIELSDGSFACLIKRNTTIPVSVSKTFIPESDIGITINVYEGLRVMACDNHKIGSFTIEFNDLVSNREIEITFSVDSNGILTIITGDLEVIVNNSLEKHIDSVIKDAEENLKYDLIIVNNKKAQDVLEVYCKELLEEFSENLEVSSKISEILEWSHKNPNLSYTDYDSKQNLIYFLVKDL